MKKIINFNSANCIYSYLVKKKEILYRQTNNLISKHPYFLFSNRFDRDILASDSIDTFFRIALSGRLLIKDLYISLTKDQKFAFNLGRFLSKKQNYNFLKFILKNSNYLLFKIIKNSFFSIISLIDLIIVIFISLIYTLNNKKRISKITNFHDHNIEIYSIYYWSTKKDKTTTYYYPDFYLKDYRYAFVSIFFNYKYIFKGLLDSFNDKRIFNALDFVNYKIIFSSILILIKIYLFDLFVSKPSLGNIISFLDSFRLLSKRFYSLLNYKVSENIITYLKPKIIYLWTENHLLTKPLNVGLSEIITKNNKDNINLITYLGYPYHRSHFPHLTPTYNELKNHFWGLNNFMLLDQDSKSEMFYALKNHAKLIKFLKPRKSLNRYNVEPKKNNEFNIYDKLRFITFFSHSTYQDLFIMIYRFFNNEYIIKKFNFRKDDQIFIRLHPSLDKNKIKRMINNIKNQYKLKIPKIKFIENELESVEFSIKNSEYCIFTNSNLINTALSLDKKVIALKTSFLYDPIIKNHFYKNKKLVML